jgi:UDP-N-acetylmuramoyl-tripeptide--D-alanyl-D-alanine ligase
MKITLKDIAYWVNANSIESEQVVSGIQVDSRKIQNGDLFCAVIGKQHDGHDYIEEAFSKGAIAAIVTRTIKQPSKPVFLVESIQEALAKIATKIRENFNGDVIGVTGSVGKTTVKTMIATALQLKGDVLESPQNLNTEYGLPMTWMQLTNKERFVVLEMAMRGLGQIKHLCSFSKPTAGVITRIGTSHIGELGSKEKIAEAKAELLEALPSNGVAILPKDDEFYKYLNTKCNCTTITFGKNTSANVKLISTKSDLESNSTEIILETENKTIHGVIPGLGQLIGYNAAAAIATCKAMQIDPQLALNKLAHIKLPPARLESIKFQGAYILVDTYNSSLESCAEALKVMATVQRANQKIAILGDIYEQGEWTEETHRKLGRMCVDYGVTRIVLVGRSVHWTREEAIQAGFTGRIDLLAEVIQATEIISKLEQGDIVLIKGSRAMQLEQALIPLGIEVFG